VTELREGLHGLLAIDKPLGPTSRDVVNRVVRLLRDRHVGHAGTLDPQASGVLVLAFGEAAKAVRWLQQAPKTYETVVQLGVATSTDDAAGEVRQTLPVPPLTWPQVVAALPAPGALMQVPPAVSALQQDGVRDHERVRRGEVVVRPSRPVRLYEVELLELMGDRLRLRVQCGAGFYVRALARDLGLALGTLGHVATLRRTAGSGLTLTDCATLAELERDPEPRHRLRPLRQALGHVLTEQTIDDATALALRQGKRPPAPLEEQPARLLVLPEGELVCIAEVVGGHWQVVRGFHHVARKTPPPGVRSESG
jgi:tRNA pseudouridine55 synthase